MNIYITNKAWQKMRAYVDNCQDEISGLGKVAIIDSVPVVTDVAIFNQVVTAASTDIHEDEMAKFQVELIKKGEDPSEWVCWWHSHAKMDAFFSGTDTSTIDESTDYSHLISIVTNHAHKLVGRVDYFEPIRMDRSATVHILPEESDKKLIEEIKKEIQEKVKKKPVKNKYSNWKPGVPTYNTPRQTNQQSIPPARTVQIDDVEDDFYDAQAAQAAFIEEENEWLNEYDDLVENLNIEERLGNRKRIAKARKKLQKHEEYGHNNGWI